MKDPYNCPFCQAEIYGYSEAWGMSEEGWEYMRLIHLAQHCEKCLTCGQSIEVNNG